ncbi:translocation and assembly module lipoprotein TamL [Mesohalobacter halotolerans]|uniref:translocation and assembly module lipoprotein TamL n=1 Tax=Mesohalobacter halotolerans TaxID=1883405 RepID=UPI001FE311AA|nr:BamA/TamA family outer membrane protein [Mesohalobacter halotolerans]
MSCNSTKRVADDEFLLTENTIDTGVDSINANTLKPFLSLKPNSKFLFGIPLKLYIYNWGKPKPDSLFVDWLKKNPNRENRWSNFLSERQLKNLGEFYVDIHEGRRKNGEPPSIITDKKLEQSRERLKSWYWNRGWFDAEVNYDIKKDTLNQKAKVNYKITPNRPYIIDSISYNIASPVADSVYNTIKPMALIKEKQLFNSQNFEGERLRIEKYFRNHGLYHFDRDYISFIADSLNDNSRQLDIELNIKNREKKVLDTAFQVPFKVHKISQVNVFTDYKNKSKYIAKDSVSYNNITFYAEDRVKINPKILADAIFIEKGQLFSDEKRKNTYNRFSNIRIFDYPNINYQKDPRTPGEDNLIANIFLTPKKRFGFTPNFEVSQSNIQDFGIGVNTSFLARNAFHLADILELSFRANLGSSKDAASSQDQFFNITELGGNLSLSIPKILFPFTQSIIKKNMQPFTRATYGFNTQQNIGLDRQNHTLKFDYNWKPNQKISNRFSLLDFQFVNNLNINNYFNIFTNSYRDLNGIAQDNIFEVNANFIDQDTGNLIISSGTDGFIDQVQNNEVDLEVEEQQLFNSIVERKDRLTENNLIIASNFNFDYSTRENIDDEDYYQFRSRFELAGNLLQGLGSALDLNKNDNGDFTLFDVPFSQYAKVELNYIKHWDLGDQNIIATRAYGGIALPYGNSRSIPFARSFFGGGPNDNRGWQPYDLGPGKTNGVNDFNEANFKLSFNFEYRFNVFGNLNSALFVDAGNIWNVADNVTNKDATFDGFQDLEDLSIATGFGFRYDISFFVIRLDFGFKTYNPGDPEQRWFSDYNFRNMVFNFGINYPF